VRVDQGELTSAYLEAVGLQTGAAAPDMLGELVRRHVATFAFSSVGPRLGDPLPLEPDAIFDRIVVRRRGGYCFEQNGLMFVVLEQLGLDPRLVLGRVLLSGNPHPGLTHRISVVELDAGPHVVDVGFGARGPHLPVPLGGDVVGSTWRRFRVVELRPGHWTMQTAADDGWLSLYRFELHEYGASDCEVGHFYSHRHPAATFVRTLVASRILDDEVRSLAGRDYRVLRADGEQRRTVEAADLQALLADELEIRVTAEEAARLLPPES